jgi:hypothetical protein
LGGDVKMDIINYAKIKKIEKQKFIEKNKPMGYVEEGLVRHYDYTLQKKLVDGNYIDKNKWYDIAENSDAVLSGYSNIEDAYGDDGMIINTAIEKQRIVIDDINNTNEFTIEITGILMNDDGVAATCIFGYPFNSYVTKLGNQISFNNQNDGKIWFSKLDKLSTITITCNRTNGTMVGYVDGYKTTEAIISGATSFVKHMQLGKAYQDGYVNSKYINIKLYDRQLTPNEVLQNAISTKIINPLTVESRIKPPVKPIDILDIKLEDTGVCVPLELSNDGKTLWGFCGKRLVKSTDGFYTKDDVYTFEQGGSEIKELSNGCLIVALNALAGVTNGSIWLSNKDKTIWTKVLESSSDVNGFSQPWGGISHHNNVVVCGEYGSKTPPKNARKVFLSLDYGQTFNEIFDLGLINEAHIHGVAYDKFYKRIWICNGDSNNKCIRFSDDYGETWNVVSNEYQAVGIIPTRDSVIFTMDGYPNGIMTWKRTTKEDRSLKLEPTIFLNPEGVGTLFCGHRHYISKDGIVYMPVLPTSAGRPSYVFATKDGINIYKLFEVTPSTDVKGITSILPDGIGGLIGMYREGDNNNLFRNSYTPEWY